MKALMYLSIIVAALIAERAFCADVPSLVGTWTGQRDRIAKVEGRRGGLATLVITEQQANTFTGRLKRSNPTGDEEEALWGAFTPGGDLMMGSDDEGTYIFRLINQNTLDYCYSEARPIVHCPVFSRKGERPSGSSCGTRSFGSRKNITISVAIGPIR